MGWASKQLEHIEGSWSPLPSLTLSSWHHYGNQPDWLTRLQSPSKKMITINNKTELTELLILLLFTKLWQKSPDGLVGAQAVSTSSEDEEWFQLDRILPQQEKRKTVGSFMNAISIIRRLRTSMKINAFNN